MNFKIIILIDIINCTTQSINDNSNNHTLNTTSGLESDQHENNFNDVIEEKKLLV